MTTNNRISNIVSSQVPFFVRNDHENFVKFLEAYYEYLEQEGKVVERGKNLTNYFDVDNTIDEFRDKLYEIFLKLIPDETVADKTIILKNAKDLYRAKGTEKSVQFLLRAIFGEELVEPSFYYPKADILRASDGKWFIEKSIKIADIQINGTANNTSEAAGNFVNRKITGNTSGATAIIERVDTYYEGDALVRELKLSNQTKDFRSGETIFALFEDGDVTKSVTANIFSGIIVSVRVLNGGSLYVAGQTIPLISNTGTGGVVTIDTVSSGNVKSILLVEGGSGFQVNNQITFTPPAGKTGSGALANVLTVKADGSVHSNSYNIISATISLEANTAIGNTTYGNLVSSLADPANSAIANSMTYFTYANTGPISSVLLLSSGSNYSATPTPIVSGNNLNFIRNAGILGHLEIVNGGTGYVVGDSITFTNVSGGSGQGANANVVTVNATGSITGVKFQQPIDIYPPGGVGYDQQYLPIANVISTNVNAVGANIVVRSILGRGEKITVVSETLGVIQSLRIISGGQNYDTAPILDLTGFGDGKAQANSTIVTGIFSYPGRYLNDDGFLSGYNFLENRDYYQPFSYVVKTNRSIERYRKYLKDLLHPAGLKLFGEYLTVDDDANNNVTFQSVTDIMNKLALATYKANGNGTATFVEITTGRNVSNVANAYLEFISVDRQISNLSILVDRPTTVTGNAFTANIVKSIAVNNTSNLEAKIVTSDPTKISLVKFTPVNNTSNLLFNTGTGGTTNNATLVKYVPVNAMSNLQARTEAGGLQTKVRLVEYTVVNNTSNIVVSTGLGATATLNLVQFTPVNLFSDLKVNTGSGALTNTVSLVRAVTPFEQNVSNLTYTTGAGISTNTLTLTGTAETSNVVFANGRTITVNGVTTVITSTVPTSNQIRIRDTISGNISSGNNIVLFMPVDSLTSNLSVNAGSGPLVNTVSLVRLETTAKATNLAAKTAVSSGDITDRIELLRFVTDGNTSNLIFSSEFADATNRITLQRFVSRKTVLVENVSNLYVSTGIGASVTVANLVSIVPTRNVSNLTINTAPTSSTNTVILDKWLANSNIFFEAGYTLNIANMNVVVTSACTNSRVLEVTPAVSGNLSGSLVVYEKVQVSRWRANSNVAMPNTSATIVRIGNRDYTLANSNPNSNNITISPALPGNLVANTLEIISYFDASIANVSNLEVRTGSGANNETRVINLVQYTPVNNSSNLTGATGTRATIVNIDQFSNLTVNLVSAPSNTVSLISHFLQLNTSNLSYTTNSQTFFALTPSANTVEFGVDRIFLNQWAGNSNVGLTAGALLSVNGANVRIVSTNANSNVVVVSPFVSSNLDDTLLVYQSQFKRANIKDSNVYFSNGYTLIIGSQTLTVTNANANSNLVTFTSNVTSNLTNASLYVANYNSNGRSTVISLTRVVSINNTANLTVNTIAGSPTNTLTLNRPLATSNVPFGTGYTLLIGGANTVTVTSSNASSNTLLVTPAIRAGLRANSVRVISFVSQQNVGNSNTYFKEGFYLGFNNIESNVRSNLTFSTGSGASITRINLTAWAANSNIAISNGTVLNVNNTITTVSLVIPSSSQLVINPGVNGNLVANSIIVYPTVYANVVTANQTSNTFTIDRELSTNLVNLQIVVVSHYRDQWIANSNIAFGNDYRLVINGSNTTTVLTSNPTSSGIVVTHPVMANLTNASIFIDGYYQTRTLRQSNVAISNGHFLNIQNRPVRVTDCDPDSSVITFKDEFPGKTTGNSFNVQYYYVPQNLGSSNNVIKDGYRIEIGDSNGAYVVTSSDPNRNFITVTPSLPIDFFANSVFIQAYYKDEWPANSNVAIGIGSRINVGNITRVVTSISSDNNLITINPGITDGNLVANTIVVKKHYADVWAGNSNVFFANGYTITVNGTNTVVVTNVNARSNTVTVTPAITGNLFNVSLNVVSFYKPVSSNVSNVFFESGYTLNIGEAYTVNVTSTNARANTITVDSSIPGLQVNSSLRIVSFYRDQWFANSNVTFDTGHTLEVNGVSVIVTSADKNFINVSPAIEGSLVNANIKVVSYYTNQWAGNSNVFFGTGYKLNIANAVSVTVTSSNQQSALLTFTPALSGNSRNNFIRVESFYKDEWVSNSNVAFGNNYVLTVNGKSVTVIDSQNNNTSIVSVWPPFANAEVNASITVASYYERSWASNSNVYFTVGDTLGVNNRNVVVQTIDPLTIGNTSNLTFSTSFNANSNTVNIITLSANAGLSNVAFINANNYRLTINGVNVSILTYNPNSNVVVLGSQVPANIVANSLVVSFETNTRMSRISFTPSLTGNTFFDGIIVYRPVEVSNGVFNVTSNTACTNSYYYIISGKSINANGSVYATV